MGNTRVIKLIGTGASYELTVNPRELSVTQTSGNKTINLLNVGEVVIAGNRGTIKTVINTFLPAPNSPFYKGQNPEELITRIKQWKNGRQPLRIIISGTDVNTMFLVEGMEEKYKEGQYDIAVNWSFVEYRVLNVPATATTAFVNNINRPETLKSRTGKIEIPKKTTVRVGDSLWGYAIRYYGDGRYWKKIAEANGITNPDSISIGMILEIPQL